MADTDSRDGKSEAHAITWGHGLTALAIPLALLLIWLVVQGPQHWFMVSLYSNKSTPVRFYGQVVDQQGRPVAGATVSVRILAFNWQSLLGERNYTKAALATCESDRDGKFQIEHSSGIELQIVRVEAFGFAPTPEQPSGISRERLGGFRYARERGIPYYVPDPSKPAVIPLRKKGEPRTVWPSRGGKDEPNSWNTPTSTPTTSAS